MKKQILKISICIIGILILLTSVVCGQTLTINMETEKTEIEKGEKFKLKVEWSEKMQAADFIINYDEKRLKVLSADIGEDYYNCENNQIKIAWLDKNAQNTRTSMEIELEAIKSGKVELSTEISGGFADENIQMPTNYENSKLELKIVGGISPIVYIIIAIIILIFGLIILKKKKTKK